MPSAMQPAAASRYARAILFLVAFTIIVGGAVRIAGFVGGSYSWFIHSSAGDDSWMPMRLAFAHVHHAAAGGSLYDVFFLDHVKFQYPPSSLLLLSAVSLLGLAPTDRVMNTIVWLSILATPFLVYATALRYIRNQNAMLGYSRRDAILAAACFGVATLFFYPIMISWRLGQVQAVLDLLFAASCLCWVSDRKAAAGAFIGASCLIKPQFALFLVWAVLRGETAFLLGQALTFAAGIAVAVALYGWQPFPDYLTVLRFISRHGEVFWDNTSVNGLVNRWYHPDETLIFHYHSWVAYNPVVYVCTVVSSAAIVGFTLFVLRPLHGRDSALDFMAAAFCFTLAAPIAWGHHFGVALPLLAVILIALGREAPSRPGMLWACGALCFLAFAVDWNITDLLGGTRFTILQSWRLFAAFAVLWLLRRLAVGRQLAVQPEQGWVRPVPNS